ncbi:MAG: hypothetical protein R3280_10315 [Marinobacter sp.]|uniref:hypothetical protein n=1 Tax=Marinobacter sp. TaxID=50741 RepID=UPI00299E3A52|nr:hypothetical protein [Marinobacter sp.]MDX1635023.1 hypothetical protein [Marinobacter sp.]
MADQDVDKLRKEMDQLRNDMRTITETLKTMAVDRGERGYEQVRASVDQARDGARRASQAVESQIEDKPFSSVLLTFVVGLITGLLVQSRR